MRTYHTYDEKKYTGEVVDFAPTLGVSTEDAHEARIDNRLILASGVKELKCIFAGRPQEINAEILYLVDCFLPDRVLPVNEKPTPALVNRFVSHIEIYRHQDEDSGVVALNVYLKHFGYVSPADQVLLIRPKPNTEGV